MSDKPRECKEHEYQCYKCGEGYAPLLVRDFPRAANAMEEASFLYGELRKVHGLLVAAKGSTLVPQDFDIEHIRKALEICGQSSKPSQGQKALELVEEAGMFWGDWAAFLPENFEMPGFLEDFRIKARALLEGEK